jgi:hypothetical protein
MALGMHYTFEQAQDHLRAELFGRQTIDETLTFVEALAAEARKSAATRFIVWVRNSRPIFKVEQVRVSDSFKQLAVRGVRVALLADSEEVRASHQYIEVLATQQGAKVRAFRDEARALSWLRSVASAQSHE